MTRVTKTSVPQRRGRRGEGMSSDTVNIGRADGVEVAGATAAKNHAPGPKVLYRETKGVKLYKTKVVPGELSNGQEVPNNGWDN